jgi:acyl dehydratase
MSVVVDRPDQLRALQGKDLGYSDWMPITQERVNTFADASDDYQWIHIDEERAKAGPFGAPIAHGYLTLALTMPLFADLLHIKGVSMRVSHGLNRVRFPAPVPVGAKIRVGGRIVEVEEIAGNSVEMTVDFEVEVDGADEPACVAQAVYRHYGESG